MQSTDIERRKKHCRPKMSVCVVVRRQNSTAVMNEFLVRALSTIAERQEEVFF
jgi:hypothetical protein